MNGMEQFLTRYPNVGKLIIAMLACGLLAMAQLYGKEVIDNNTEALEKLTAVLETVEARVNDHAVLLREHGIRLNHLEREE